jgi:hypothetical protein
MRGTLAMRGNRGVSVKLERGRLLCFDRLLDGMDWFWGVENMGSEYTVSECCLV